MHLKKIELIGFKSFAGKTEVHFDRGVTCVVGPNGCGKSNISDSIRWVLGERSAKILRGAKMEDVIFNGTDFRKPVGYAEVSLTIDNADKGLAIEYTEVTITRRLHRSGESEYFINKTACRLKDIEDLILDTGIGSSAYSMIGQGRIDYILNADADERRFLIEEAAGISKFKVKKEEALRKLQRTEENLLRLKDIVLEVQKNIQYAERQAKRAEKYKEQLENLKSLEIRKAFYDLSILQQQKIELETERSGNENRITDLFQKIEEIRAAHEAIQARLREILNSLSHEESKRYSLRSQIEQNQQKLRFHQEKRVEFATRRGEIQQEEVQLNERLTNAQTDITAKQSELESFDSDKNAIEGDLSAVLAGLKASEEQLGQIKSVLDQTRSAAFETAAELTHAKNDFHRMHAFLETSSEQKQKLQVKIDRFNTEKNQWENKRQVQDQEFAQLSGKIQEFENSENKMIGDLKNLKSSWDQTKEQIEQYDRLIHEKETRLALLKEMDQASLLNLRELPEDMQGLQNEFIRSIRDVLHVQPGYEIAVEAVLGYFSQSLILENRETAERFLNYVIEKKMPSPGIILRSEVAAGEVVSDFQAIDFAHPLVLGSLRNFVTLEPGYEALLSPVLANIFVFQPLTADNLQEALALSRNCKLVTLEGVCLGPSGWIRFQNRQSSEQGFFQRGNEINTIESELQQLKDSRALSEGGWQRLADEVHAAESRLKTVQLEHFDSKIQKEACESLRSGAQERLSSFEQEIQILIQELQDLELRQQEVSGQKRECEQILERIIAREKEIHEQQEELSRQIAAAEGERSIFQKTAAEKEARLNHLLERNQLLQESIRVLLEAQGHDQERLEGLSKEMLRITEKEKHLSDEDAVIHKNQNQLEEQVRECEISLELMRQDKEKQESSLAALEKQSRDFLEEQQSLQTAQHQLEMKIMDLGFQEKTIAERLEQAYHIQLSELRAEDFPLGDTPYEELAAEMAKLQDKVKSLGTVNLLAIEEYEELKKRFDFLNGQQTDLEQARESLLEAIRKINRTTKELFQQTFETVQKNFLEYYQILFRGGEARLVLVDETQPLESGIDIVVRPPGKKLQHISLLSGGEKALTAMALLFALFKIKPSPFCVLDEVDAPLDEANIDRFLAVLRTFLQSSQFIIITHNRKTIAMGDSLYGVTMEEAGVSKIVSVKIRPGEESLPGGPEPDENAGVEDTVQA